MIRVTKVIAGQVEALMRKVAEEEILPRYRKLEPSDIEQKKDLSTVTVADKCAEDALIKGLLDIIPQAMIVGEESSEKYPSTLEHLAKGKLCWVIDPLDGTSNFVSGEESRKNSGMMVALVEGDTIRGGWILDIHKKTMTYAIAGEGAFHEGKRIRAKKNLRLDFNTAVAYPNISYFTSRPELGNDAMMNENFKSYVDTVIKHLKSENIRKIRCSAVEYVQVALGKAHFSFHHFNSPWDHAAGQLIVNEAGGYAGFMDGAYRPSVQSNKNMFILCTHNKETANRLRHSFYVMKSRWDREEKERLKNPPPVQEQKPVEERKSFAEKPEQLKLDLKIK